MVVIQRKTVPKADAEPVKPEMSKLLQGKTKKGFKPSLKMNLMVVGLAIAVLAIQSFRSSVPQDGSFAVVRSNLIMADVLRQPCSNSSNIYVFPNERNDMGLEINVPEWARAAADLKDITIFSLVEMRFRHPVHFNHGAARLHTKLGLIPSAQDLGACRVFILVPADHLWSYPTVEPGHKIEILRDLHKKPVPATTMTLETLSVSPRVFRLTNFITAEEADELITLGKDKLRRSSVGKARTSYERTSSTAWLHNEELALEIQHRGFNMLRHPFNEHTSEGVQVLKYEHKQRFTGHYDFFEPDRVEYKNWTAVQMGHNRFATVFFYLNDVPLGGHTVFLNATNFHPDYRAVEGLYSNTDMKECSSGFAVRPVKAEAVLFYDMHGNHKLDFDSFHGGCPVLEGEKWGANLWIWDRPSNYWVEGYWESQQAAPAEGSAMPMPPADK